MLACPPKQVLCTIANAYHKSGRPDKWIAVHTCSLQRSPIPPAMIQQLSGYHNDIMAAGAELGGAGTTEHMNSKQWYTSGRQQEYDWAHDSSGGPVAGRHMGVKGVLTCPKVIYKFVDICNLLEVYITGKLAKNCFTSLFVLKYALKTEVSKCDFCIPNIH